MMALLAFCYVVKISCAIIFLSILIGSFAVWLVDGIPVKRIMYHWVNMEL